MYDVCLLPQKPIQNNGRVPNINALPSGAVLQKARRVKSGYTTKCAFLAQGQPPHNPHKTHQNTTKQATSAKAMCGILSPKDSPHPTHNKTHQNTTKQTTSAKAMCGILSPKDSQHPQKAENNSRTKENTHLAQAYTKAQCGTFSPKGNTDRRQEKNRRTKENTHLAQNTHKGTVWDLLA
jgi:hypothetical protein